MNTIERVAYLKGLADGMKIDESTNEGKLFRTIIEVLEDIAMDLADLGDDMAELVEQVDEIDEDLEELEDEFYGDDDEDDDEDEDLDEDALFEVQCPSCEDIICLTEDMLEEGGIECPNCGESLEFDLEDGGCGCCGHDEGKQE